MADDVSQDIQRFHRWSSRYEQSLGQFFLFNPVHRGVLSLVAEDLDGWKPECVLDIGCGTGRLLRRAASRWPAARLIGVDPAEGMVEIARRLSPTVTFLVGRGEGIPLPDSSVDIAFTTVSFHHWQDQAAGLREVARVLRPRGRLCLADGALPLGIVPHSRVHTRAEMAALFEQAGLPVIAQKGIWIGGVVATVGQKPEAIARTTAGGLRAAQAYRATSRASRRKSTGR